MTEKVVYNDPTPNNFPNDYDDSQVDSRVKIRSKSIAHKDHGKHVREALMQGIEIGSVVAGEAKNIANDTAIRQDNVDQSQKDFEDRYNEQIAGNTDLNEVIDARKPAGGEAYQTLGKRLDTLQVASNFNIDDKLISGGYVKPFFETEIERVKDELIGGLFTFAQMSDTHWETITRVKPEAYRSLNHVKNLLSFADVADLLILNGDNTNSDTVDLNGVKKDIDTIVSTFLDEEIDAKTDRFIQLGNHDDGSPRRRFETNSFMAQDNYLHDDYFRQEYRANISQGEVRNNGSLYFYKDYPDKKIRFISLNTSDIAENQLDANGSQKYARWQCHTVRQEQMNWLANVALMNVPADYHVVVTGHCPLNVNQAGGFQANKNDTFVNLDMVADLLAAFRDGGQFTGNSTNPDFPVNLTVDYSAQGKRNLVGYFSGHTHRDNISVFDDISIIEIACSVFYNNDKSRFIDTPTEDGFDIVQIDTENRNINIHGFGYCKNRSVKY